MADCCTMWFHKMEEQVGMRHQFAKIDSGRLTEQAALDLIMQARFFVIEIWFQLGFEMSDNDHRV